MPPVAPFKSLCRKTWRQGGLLCRHFALTSVHSRLRRRLYLRRRRRRGEPSARFPSRHERRVFYTVGVRALPVRQTYIPARLCVPPPRALLGAVVCRLFTRSGRRNGRSDCSRAGRRRMVVHILLQQPASTLFGGKPAVYMPAYKGRTRRVFRRRIVCRKAFLRGVHNPFR